MNAILHLRPPQSAISSRRGRKPRRAGHVFRLLTMALAGLCLKTALGGEEAHARNPWRDVCNGNAYIFESWLGGLRNRAARQSPQPIPQAMKRKVCPYIEGAHHQYCTEAKSIVMFNLDTSGMSGAAAGVFNRMQDLVLRAFRNYAFGDGVHIYFPTERSVQDPGAWAFGSLQNSAIRRWGDRQYMAKLCKDPHEIIDMNANSANGIRNAIRESESSGQSCARVTGETGYTFDEFQLDGRATATAKVTFRKGASGASTAELLVNGSSLGSGQTSQTGTPTVTVQGDTGRSGSHTLVVRKYAGTNTSVASVSVCSRSGEVTYVRSYN